MDIYFIVAYIAAGLFVVVLGYYLSRPSHTWTTLKDGAFNVLPCRSRPTSTPVQHDEQPVTSNEPHGEAEPAEVVHDEP